LISEKSLKEFIQIYKAEFGIELDGKTALAAAINLLTFFDSIYEPIRKDWQEK
jgi:hypothetical protein